MKRRTWAFMLTAALSTMLGACSSGGGTTAITPTGTSVSGVVADGYLGGAKVFIDKNNNKKWDTGEPFATTGTDGTYTLTNVAAADLAFPIVVEVPTTAVDADRGPVTQAYTLQAPAGNATFISPLTTLVQQKVESTGVTPAQAEAAVKQDLGLSPATSLFTNFKASANVAANPEYQTAANVAMVVATAMAQNTALINAQVATLVQNGTLTGDQTAAVMKLVTEAIAQQVTTIVQQVLANPAAFTGTSTAVNSAVAAMATNSVPVDTGSTLQGQLQMQNTTTVAASFKDAISGDGLFNLDSWMDWVNGASTKVYYYYKLLLGAQNTAGTFDLSETAFQYQNPGWTEVKDNSTRYHLTSSGWVLASDAAQAGNVTVNADGSITWKHKTVTGYQMTVTSTSKDVSGLAIQPFVAPNGVTVNSTAAFPAAGAKAYQMTFTPLQTSYKLHGGETAQIWNTQTQQQDNATSLAQIITTYQEGTTNPGWIQVGPNPMGVRFNGTGTTTGSTGKLNFYHVIFGANGPTLDSTLADTGSWEITEPVAGYKVMVVTLPLSIKQYMNSDEKTPILAVVPVAAGGDGFVHFGKVEYAGVPQSDNYFNFNKTAFDAILANFIIPANPNTPAPTQAVSKVSIEGTVVNANGPVAGAVVGTSLDGETATTDANGHFFLQTNTAANYSSTAYTITINNAFSQSWVWGDHPMGQYFRL